MKPEFDQYAPRYEELLRDPIRDQFARSAQFFHVRKWELLSRFFQQHHFDTQRATWLDIGCGKGELLRLGGPAFADAVGCDPSAGMLSGCSGLKIHIQPSPTVLPFADHSFDLITAVCVYHHVDLADRAALTGNAYRVLKAGGLFIVIEHNPFNPITRLIVHRTPLDADAQLLPARTARSLIASAGFHLLETTYFLYFPERVYARLDRLEHCLRMIPAGGQYAVFAAKSPSAGRVSGSPPRSAPESPL